MKKVLLVFGFCLFGVVLVSAQAGDDRLTEIKDASAKEVEEGWAAGGGIGLDFAQLALFAPRVGAGSNRIGFGGLGSVYANYKKGKFNWTNQGSLQLSVQRIGNNQQPFQKNLDVIRLASRAGLQTGSDKWFLALEANAQTLLLPTYEGNILSSDTLTQLANFLSPITFVLSPGVDYKPNENWSFFYSPASLKIIYVADDDIAKLNVHGNEEGSNSFVQLGSNFKAIYTNNFLEDKIALTSTLDLYSNYLNNPQNIDVLWQNDLSFTIFKNISLNLFTELFYDHDVLVQVDRNDNGIYEEGELGRRVSFTQALLIKYNYIF